MIMRRRDSDLKPLISSSCRSVLDLVRRHLLSCSNLLIVLHTRDHTYHLPLGRYISLSFLSFSVCARLAPPV